MQTKFSSRKCELILISSERLKKVEPLGRLFKSITENRAFLSKDETFVIIKGVKNSDDTYYYLLKRMDCENILTL